MTVNDRVRAHRQRMRERGFRMVHIWVPDVRSPEFAKAAHDQSVRLAAADRADPSTQDWIEAMTVDLWDDE